MLAVNQFLQNLSFLPKYDAGALMGEKGNLNVKWMETCKDCVSTELISLASEGMQSLHPAPISCTAELHWLHYKKILLSCGKVCVICPISMSVTIWNMQRFRLFVFFLQHCCMFGTSELLQPFLYPSHAHFKNRQQVGYISWLATCRMKIYRVCSCCYKCGTELGPCVPVG